MIDICFITDENYVLPTLVAIKSLITNNKHEVCISIVASELSEELQQLFRQLATENCKINIVIAENPCANIDTKHIYVSKAAMLKFALPHIFSDLDKILYIDGDVLILDDLYELWKTDLDGNYIAAVADMAGMIEEKHHEKYGFEKYFNSGVMLLNLKNMRKDNCSEKLIENKINDVFKCFMDQDALNETLYPKVIWLHPKFNMMWPNLKYSMEKIAQFYELDIDDIKYCYQNPIILHLTNRLKPWKDVSHPNFDLWYSYFKLLPKSKFRKNHKNFYINQMKNNIKDNIKKFLKSLFYERKDKNKKYRFLGIPLFSTQKTEDHKIISFLGIKISKKRKKIRYNLPKKEYSINFKTYSDLSNDITKNLYKIPDNIDLIVGIPRSGMIPAYMIAFLKNLPVYSLPEFVNGIMQRDGERIIKNAPEKNANVLVVDDTCSTGHAMQKAKERLKEIAKKHNLTYMCIYATPEAKTMVDIYAEILKQPRMFQWNYLNHNYVEECCFDINGVLCYDPTPEENDDGEKYINFLINARPLYIPKYKIGAIVTSRLEKYRTYTEKWLKDNGVKYNKLYMLDLPDKETRQRLNIHAKFKAEIYKQFGMCFYESDDSQAEEIALITHKPVICTTSGMLYDDYKQ